MNETSDMTRWDEIAWNGISFQKPSCWEIATIGRNYLMVGTHKDPRMEITWGNPSTTASHHRDLKLLQAAKRSLGRKKRGLSVDTWNPPQSWLDALPAHKVRGFSWINQTEKALIITCDFCHRASMLQFYQSSSEDSGDFNAIISRLLSTFRDHSEDNRQKWALFDVRATLPAAFKIKSYQFSPGFMTMDFITNGHIIRFYRWSPASVLLDGRKLSEFAEALPFYPGSTSETLQDVNRIVWEKSPSFSPLTRIAAFFSTKSQHHRLAIRHISETNRILAVRSESRKPMDSNLFDQIVADYETTA
jgi:hypothetical protein